MTNTDHRGIYLKHWCRINKDGDKNAWRNAQFTANGETGIIEGFCPFDDVIIFNNTKCVQDTVNPMETADISQYIGDIKLSALTRQKAGAWVDYLKEFWHKKYGMNGYVACSARPYFPAAQLHVKTAVNAENYIRYTDFETGEIGCSFTDGGKKFIRRTFVSRANGFAVSYTESELIRDYEIYFDELCNFGADGIVDTSRDSRIKFPQTVTKLEVAGAITLEFFGKPPLSYIDNNPQNPETSLSHSGFATAVRILTDGKAEAIGNKIKIRGASRLFMISKTDYRRDGFDMLSDVEKFCDSLQKQIDSIGKVAADTQTYCRLLAPHAEIHGRLFNSAKLEISTNKGFSDASAIHLSQTCLSDGEINREWLNLLYENSRFAAVCSHGYSTARLGGIWVGNFLPSWSGDHTLNANTNAQICGLNTGNLPECTESYINFLLDYAPDWLENAERIHGLKNAIKAPARTDGAGCGLFFSTPAGYPMIFWNAGAAWQLLPAFEYWECYGNKRIVLRGDLNIDRLKKLLDLTDERLAEIGKTRELELVEILKPLVSKLMNFWFGFADDNFYTDKSGLIHAADGTKIGEGGKYIFTPAYSPENAPDEGGNSEPVTVNTAMDIAAARDSVRMYRMLAENGIIDNYDREALELFESRIPDYMCDRRGAMKEWALPQFENRNNHRHASHLYAAWPAYEASRNDILKPLVRQAIKDRRMYASDQRTTGFGRMQLAIAAARIRDKELFKKCLYDLVGADFEYDSLMSGHDMGRAPRSFCTDNTMSISGVINEALVYSDAHGIILLPCCIWSGGAVRGIVTRKRVRINRLEWSGNKVIAELQAICGETAVKVECLGEVKEVSVPAKGILTLCFG